MMLTHTIAVQSVTSTSTTVVAHHTTALRSLTMKRLMLTTLSPYLVKNMMISLTAVTCSVSTVTAVCHSSSTIHGIMIHGTGVAHTTTIHGVTTAGIIHGTHLHGMILGTTAHGDTADTTTAGTVVTTLGTDLTIAIAT